jgi:hypothetical protein
VEFTKKNEIFFYFKHAFNEVQNFFPIFGDFFRRRVAAAANTFRNNLSIIPVDTFTPY